MSAATKQCPVCGCANHETDFFCQNCGTDLSLAGKGAIRPAAEPAPPSAAAPPPPEPRRCPKCGQVNDAVLLLCTNCGFDLSITASGGAKTARLFLLAGQETFECKDGDVLGREGTVARSFFGSIGTVSRRHVQFAQREGRWFVSVAPGVQNLTQLDGRELSRGAEQPLSGEHALRLSTQCEVRLRVVVE